MQTVTMKLSYFTHPHPLSPMRRYMGGIIGGGEGCICLAYSAEGIMNNRSPASPGMDSPMTITIHWASPQADKPGYQ